MLHSVKAVAVRWVAGGALALSCVVAQSDPVFSDTGYAADAYGAAEHYPLPERAHGKTQKQFVGYYTHFDQIYPAHTIAKAGTPSILKSSAGELTLDYPYDGRIRSIDSYLDRNPVTALLIARDDTILYEHYQYARKDSDRFMSQSMAKTLVGMLIGIAISEGTIHSIDDLADVYVPELAGTAYGETSIRDLLHMSSGVQFHEDSNPGDDRDKLGADLFAPNSVGAIEGVKRFNTRVRPPGTHFSYASIETEVLGLVLSHAAHMPVAQYASERIWKKMGMESDASWVHDPTGQDITFCCVSATLRDWARLGLMLAHDGEWNGKQIVPRDWIVQATTVSSPGSFLAPGRATPVFGYGYQVWILPGEHRMFALMGMDGQRIIVDPRSKLVLVQTAAWTSDHDPDMLEVFALWGALVAEYG
ncbi:serine hydrolase domain-containing protein [Paraburkholderia sp. BCC1885]|uniref:serine hydrolase domain-containing protein n=1 Tax=Paraburkholderia sp. BCC1885 TaxID=2562669 RepID=UPI0011837AE7|nr:serine hydrolase [Paraburkholderia sp. BCC1885]